MREICCRPVTRVKWFLGCSFITFSKVVNLSGAINLDAMVIKYRPNSF